MKTLNYITRYTGKPDGDTLQVYEQLGGFKGLRKVLPGKPEDIITTISESGLRGRGGAGFDTGFKWASVQKNGDVYLVCNADEGEPGTFKDRYIMERSPFLIIEGMTIAGYAVGSHKGFLYIRGEYPEIFRKFQVSLETARLNKLLGENILGSGFSFDIEIKKGGGSYVVGDETALLNSLMGNRGFPMLKPPYPTEAGLWGKPTLINNVETFALVPLITELGSDAFRSIGSHECPGPKLFSVSGHVKSPGVYELPMGTKVRDVLELSGGVKGYLKAVQIGGTAGPIYDERVLDYHLDFESMRKIGGSLGSGAIVVMNSSVNMVEVLEVTARFFSEESCGQCFPCRYGTRQIHFMANKIAHGGGKLEYIDLILDTAKIMYASSYCPFGQSIMQPLTSLFKYFGDEIISHIKQQRYLREAG